MFPFGPLFIPLIIILVEFVFRKIIEVQKSDQPIKKDKTVFSDIVRKFEESFEIEPRQTPAKSENKDIDSAQVRRDQRVKAQKERVSKHSDYDRNIRLHRGADLKRESLAKDRINMHVNQINEYDDYDLDKRRKLTIETVQQSHSRRSLFSLDLSDDLVKGVIFSEIFDKPKSIC